MGSEPKTIVVNYRVDKCDTYIGRPTTWGNPYTHRSKGTLAKYVVSSREDAVSMYRKYILERLVSEPNLRKKFETDIHHRVLGCWCKPSSCHGDILAEIAGQLDAGVDLESQLKATGEEEDDCTIKKSGPSPID